MQGAARPFTPDFKMPEAEVFVAGSGPNGLAAAIESARAGLIVAVLEQADRPGGGMRSAELTLPGFLHDVCSAIHPLAAASPFFKSLALERFGLEWIHPASPLAHPFDDGSAAVLERSVSATAAALGKDGTAYARLFGPLVERWERIAGSILGPLRIPRHPAALARFALSALRSAKALAEGRFQGEKARGLFAGLAAHSLLSLNRLPSAAFGLVLGICAHRAGWPMPRGGSQRLADALVACLEHEGGAVQTNRRIDGIEQLPSSRIVFFDVTPRQLLRIAGKRLGRLYRRQLAAYRYGPGVFKVDWALDAPIPWRAPDCLRAGTVHLGGTLEEITRSEDEVADGGHPDHPFVVVAQQSLFDPSRAPEGKHTAWAYCHVPNGSTFDMTSRIEGQLERFAPGFRDRILARHTVCAADLESYNPNLVGGDIGGGLSDLSQLFFRPVPRMVPYRTGAAGLYICSSSTPPGGGVHGMCGYHAARVALKDMQASGRDRKR